MAADKLPYMPWYGYDYEADQRCKLLDDLEHGVYFRLLWEQWKEGSIPADPAQATKLIGSDHPDVVARMLGRFFAENGTPGQVRNQRLHAIRREIEARRVAQSKGGKRGRSKQLASNPEDSPGLAGSEPGLGLGIPEPEPEPERDKAKTKSKDRGADFTTANTAFWDTAFAAFWAAYPKRAGGNPQPAARKRWESAIARGTTIATLQAGVERYAAFCQATGKIGTELVKQAQFWLAPGYEGWAQNWGAPVEDALGFGDDDFDMAPSA